MANAFYTNAKQKFVDGTIDWDTTSIKSTLVNAGYTFSAAHADLANLGANVLSGITNQTIGGRAVSSAGVASGNSITFSGLAGAQTLKATIVYADMGGGVTWLLVYYDTGAGYPLTTTGADVTIDWNGTPTAGTLFTVS